MASVPQSHFLDLVGEILMLFHESSEFHQVEELQKALREARQVALNIRRRLLNSRRQYVAAIVGLSNVGKSTLLNALLGSDMAPRRNGPCTAVPIEFTYGEEMKLSVQYHNSLQRSSWTCRNVEEIHEHLQRLADDGGSETNRRTRKVIVEFPHEILASGLVIADTPGFGAAQPGSAEGSHEIALKEYLHEEVSQVFWVVLAEQGIGKREKAFHEKFLSEICDDILVTGCEGWDLRDCDRFRGRFESQLGQHLPEFHFVSGKQGLEARNSQDEIGLKKAGIRALERRLRELSDPLRRNEAQAARLLQLVKDMVTWFEEFRADQEVPNLGAWRPDSWDRWISNAPKLKLKRSLTNELEKVNI